MVCTMSERIGDGKPIGLGNFFFLPRKGIAKFIDE